MKSGRCGDWVWYVWKGQQWRRRWVKPLDHKTPEQMYWRARLAAASKAYHEQLTQEQRQVYIRAGAQKKTKPRLSQSGKHSGLLYWVSEQCKKKT